MPPCLMHCGTVVGSISIIEFHENFFIIFLMLLRNIMEWPDMLYALRLFATSV
jgi:hypothetical protein